MSVKDKKYDVIIVGAGPSGIFTAYELNKIHPEKKILIIEKGKSVHKRSCPIPIINKCIKCKPYCNITTGFAGAGAFSDAKLSLYDSEVEEVLVGGNLPNVIGHLKTKKLIDYCDKVYLDFGGEKNISGVENKAEIKSIKNNAKNHNINLVDIPIRHLGTEKSRELYGKLEDYLRRQGVEMLFETPVNDLIIDNGEILGVTTENDSFYGEKTVISVGRNGADMLSDLCDRYGIEKEVGIVDIGVRFEMRSEGDIKRINELMYEGKFIGKVAPFKDKVRTFCQNPDGFVAAEVYDNGLSLVNGHAYKEKKSINTNFAILCSHNFTEPFNKPIEYAHKVAELTNLLSNGEVVVQRFGDILKGKRTWQEELDKNSVEATLKTAMPGDITLGIPYRTMTNIINFILEMDKVVKGFADPDNLLYGPEIKFYSNAIKLGENLETNIKNLYAIGDGAGLTRGLMMASCSGVYLARNLFI
ncbi:NAD(P)/FAD-dependent oxidoreductase [Clostridium septicum]|uniref:FAD-dependent oxidoreductase n=1 Tax=Clostridium septicum TaxID=1504 RepID=A0A9N7JKY6_CLOSE|nr:FAD-dependent oxidoreductase [Clostridium septicum]AYE34358.1 FAD-dependent oxidoreductase [Clostridium septicum]MDU1314318.1 FAD-dependent oxidoreductase [Clostridium septicum]QAS59763.1 FAD-dependent oxidoreductase [Clostridium septicum]UEC21001.1 FAD-dependent oxidoreductase [Clostridium septicum]USS00950.1 FAD-dependent oxidoreductase [Clostridium septicum]